MDFEFSMVNRNGIVLISGAISNSLDRYKTRTLQGRPLYLPAHEEVRPMKNEEMQEAQKEIYRILRGKTEIRDACLDQLDKSLRTSVNSLNATYIKNYILKDDKKSVIVVWNCSSNKNILKKLGITEFPLLNITCNDKNLDKNFTIQLEKVENKQIIFEIDIGTFNKNGRLLNVEETHELICGKKHKITHANNPRTNVIYTKCIFDYVIRRCKYENLVQHFT